MSFVNPHDALTYLYAERERYHQHGIWYTPLLDQDIAYWEEMHVRQDTVLQEWQEQQYQARALLIADMEFTLVEAALREDWSDG